MNVQDFRDLVNGRSDEHVTYTATVGTPGTVIVDISAPALGLAVSAEPIDPSAFESTEDAEAFIAIGAAALFDFTLTAAIGLLLDSTNDSPAL